MTLFGSAGPGEFPSPWSSITSVPWLSLAQLGIGIAGTLESQFGGTPRGAATEDAIGRLLRTGNPALIKLARQLAYLYGAGFVLSASAGPLRNQWDQYFGEALRALEAQGYPKAEAFRIASGLLEKQTGYGTYYGSQTLVGSMIPPPPKPAPSVGLKNYFMPNFGSEQSFEEQFKRAGELGGAASALYSGQPELLPELTEVGGAIGAQFGQKLDSLDKFITGFFKGPSAVSSRQPVPPPYPVQPGPGGLPIQTGQTGEVPTLDQTKACVGCQRPTQRQLQELRAQEGQLRQEITTEQQQQTDKQIQDQQRQIDRLKQLESKPADTRDIPSELQQKEQLLSDIQQEIAGQPTPETSTGGGAAPVRSPVSGEVPTLQNYHPVQVEPVPSAEPQPMIQRQPTGEFPHPLSPEAVKFCVQCTSQAESLKFLNGEPAQCSVVAG